MIVLRFDLFLLLNFLFFQSFSFKKFLHFGLLDFFEEILETDHSDNFLLKKYTFFSISNCLASNRKIIAKIMEHKIFDHKFWKDLTPDYQVEIIFLFF